VSEWHFLHGWSGGELDVRLEDLARARTTSAGVDTSAAPELHHYGSEATVAQESPGPAGATFAHARQLLSGYTFSDPRLVVAHFDPQAPLLGRNVLLEIHILGLRYLCGARVGDVRDQRGVDRTVFGFRMDTLEGHIETGSEWLLLGKDHRTGAITLGIRAAWMRGELPNWWTRLGFQLLSRPYQRAWHRLANVRMRSFLATGEAPALSRPRFTYGKASHDALGRFLEVEREPGPVAEVKPVRAVSHS
jgi:uncharacterized protein (UPF0548 family)